MAKKESMEVEFLNFIYKGADMGVIGIDNVITKVQNEKMEKLLKTEREEYENIKKETENVLKKYGRQTEEVGTMAKMSTKMMSEMEMLKDNSDQTIAKMMMEGSNKGVIEIQEKINNYKVKDAEIIVLANKLKSTIENNIDDLKKYL